MESREPELRAGVESMGATMEKMVAWTRGMPEGASADTSVGDELGVG